MATFTKIASNTVSTAVASITFSSIPQTYTDLIIKYSARDANAQTYGAFDIQFNGSGGTAYAYRILQGTGSAASSSSQSGLDRTYGVFTITGANATANTFSNGEIYIPNYTSANNKSLSLDNVNENNATEAYATLNASLWANTSAITSIRLASNSSNLQQYSTFTLYGIKNS